MVTQCPVCLQWFRIGSGVIEAAHGLARCGECEIVFNARATLREQQPPLRDRESAARAAADGTTAAAAGNEMADGDGSADAALAPLLETRAQPPRRAHWPWAAAVVLAVFALAAQLVHANRYAIARLAVAGPALAAMYRAFGAPLDDRLGLGRYLIAAASLDAAPGSGRALVLDGRLINRAPYAQRLPLIRLSLSDRRGNAIAARMLLPSDYEATNISVLAAGQTLRFHVKFTDPGMSAVGFTLLLCKRRGDRVVCMGS